MKPGNDLVIQLSDDFGFTGLLQKVFADRQGQMPLATLPFLAKLRSLFHAGLAPDLRAWPSPARGLLWRDFLRAGRFAT